MSNNSIDLSALDSDIETLLECIELHTNELDRAIYTEGQLDFESHCKSIENLIIKLKVAVAKRNGLFN